MFAAEYMNVIKVYLPSDEGNAVLGDEIIWKKPAFNIDTWPEHT